MPPQIQFVKTLKDAKLPEITGDVYVVHHKDYAPPTLLGIKGQIEFGEFRCVYTNIHANMLIFYGLNKIITPANRTDFVFEFLFTVSADVQKISIDHAPFVGEPWRLWFHYGLCKRGHFGTPYSYALESEWKHWFYRDVNDSRFEAANLGICIDSTYSNLDALAYRAEFEDADEEALLWYEGAKKSVFNKYDTPKLLILNLLKVCNAKFKLKYDMDSYLDGAIKVPDLPIYRFVDEENRRRAAIYNKVIEVGAKL